jgi:hypothetical protein
MAKVCKPTDSECYTGTSESFRIYKQNTHFHVSDESKSVLIYVTIKLSCMHSLLLYGYKIWSPTLREKYRLRMSENRVL